MEQKQNQTSSNSRTKTPAKIQSSGEGAGAIESAEKSVERSKEMISTLEDYMEDILEEGIDFKNYSWANNPFLHKPGAEQLQKGFELQVEPTEEKEIIDYEGPGDDGLPFIMYKYRYDVYTKNGRFITAVSRSANSFESRFRTKSDSNGNTINRPPEEIMADIDSIEAAAQKRAYVNAIRQATGASRMFKEGYEGKRKDREYDGPTNVNAENDIDPSELKYPFGDSEGVPLNEVPTDDLEWFLSDYMDEEKLNDEEYGDKNQEMKRAAEMVLEAREEEHPGFPPEDEGSSDSGSKKSTAELFQEMKNLADDVGVNDDQIKNTFLEYKDQDPTEVGFSELDDDFLKDIISKFKAIKDGDEKLEFTPENSVKMTAL